MAGRRGARGGDDEEIELNMTPMLDVVFILLIFFIVTAVFVKEPGIEVERPDVTRYDQIKPPILIAVSNEDEIWINKREVDPRDLKAAIEAARAENPKGEASVQADAGANFAVVYDVMETLQEMGIPKQFVSIDEEK